MAKIQTRSAVKKIMSYPLGSSPEEIKQKFNLKAVRKMSDNENVYGCSPDVKESISKAISSLYFYPDGTVSQLIRKLAEFYGINEEKFLVSNGSEEIIRLLTRAYISPGDEAVMAQITFPRYQTNVAIEGGKSVTVPVQNGTHDLEGMYAKINAETKMVFICNPNNPTGTIAAKKDLYSFIQKIPPNILIVLDEAYYEYVRSEDYLDSISLLDKYPNLIILRTFSKIYGLAGLRVGYGMMDSDIVKELHKVKDVYNVNHLAQAAAAAALNDQAFVKDCAEKNANEMKFVCQKLKELKIGFFPSQTNFIYIFSQHLIAEGLISQGLVVRQMKLPGYADACRMTLGTRDDNEAAVNVIKKLLNEKGCK
ncbi:histidinol-phosphate transaminase [Cytobacillus sp. NCCP-133]|uniref:histidinol-phosphate transaminase n=1 Tax=Cytobacillus sp. NCCP-133 TaxID=766848 RepID=UPI00222F88ED|nr:histidinol-phosphate transaminase [Cytobacillus sp. NCCP-133]GLB60810.1 histidinol-phosphate aminotransferase 1 [Cytobacillus sp. NCCP-133]